MDSNKSKTKHSENRLFLIVIVVLVAIFIGFIIFTPHKDKKNQVSIEGVDISSYIEASDNNGNIADHIKGDKNAPVTLFEYADFQCSGCANFNPWSKELLKEFDGKVPDTIENLTKLPGVGRKTANLIVGDIFKRPAIVVDTHCIRITQRLGLHNLKNAEKIEKILQKILPPKESNDFCHRLVLHGRAVCKAQRPLCMQCCMKSFCSFFQDK